MIFNEFLYFGTRFLWDTLYICQYKFRTASHLGIAEGELSKGSFIYSVQIHSGSGEI